MHIPRVPLMWIGSVLLIVGMSGPAEQVFVTLPHLQDVSSSVLVMVHGASDNGESVRRCAAVNPDGTDYRVLVRDADLYAEFYPVCNGRNIAALAPDGSGWLQVFRYPNDLDTYYDDEYKLEIRDDDGRNPITLDSSVFGQLGGLTFSWRTTWLPDSQHVLFWDKDESDDPFVNLGTGQLHLLGVAPVTDTVVAAFSDGNHRPVITITPDGQPGMAISPDGEQMLFNSYGPGSRSLDIVHLDGSGVDTLVESANVGFCVNWSLDSRQIIFEQWRETNITIEIVNVDGSGQTTLAEGRYPVWSPDGRQITFSCPGENGRYGVCLIEPDGSGLRQLEIDYSGDALSLYWSPDGSKLAFIGQRPETESEIPEVETYDLVIYDFDTQHTYTLLSHESPSVWDCGNYENAIKWSPDGEWVLYWYFLPDMHGGAVVWGDSVYYVCNLEGCRDVYDVVDTGGFISHIRWMPVR
jgi:hypothetical protein